MNRITKRQYRKYVRSLSRQFKKQLFKEQDGFCAYCQQLIEFKDFTVDHIIPISKGGRTTPINLIGACKKCNYAKADKIL